MNNDTEQVVKDMWQHIEYLTGQLFSMAEQGEWESMPDLEQERQRCINHVLHQDNVAPDFLRYKIMALLAKDALIKPLVSQQQVIIKDQLREHGQRKHARKVYGSHC